MHYTWRFCKAIEKAGAGERNRTAVISLEGITPSSLYQARSDKLALIGPFERKWFFAAVRTAAFIPTTTTPKRNDPRRDSSSRAYENFNHKKFARLHFGEPGKEGFDDGTFNRPALRAQV
jgi:hypothetical protein